MPSPNSPFIIAAISMIENIFSRQYSYFPEFELGIKQLINLVNAGGVGTVRRLELDLMHVGKVRERAIFLKKKIRKKEEEK